MTKTERTNTAAIAVCHMLVAAYESDAACVDCAALNDAYAAACAVVATVETTRKESGS